MVTLLDEMKKTFSINIDELLSLEAAGIPNADLAKRELDMEHVDMLVHSDPRTWLPIVVTRTSVGYVIIDGYHRVEAMREKGVDKIKATCKAFRTVEEVIEAVFRANLAHGLPASVENRSNYAYWLHITYPNLTQQEIAQRIGIRQSTVSVAISRREAAQRREPEGEKQPPSQTEEAPTAEEETREEGISILPEAKTAKKSKEKEARETIRKECRTLTRDAIKLLQDISPLEEAEQRQILIESLQGVEEREALFKVAQLLEQILQPPKPPKRRRRQT